MPTFNTTSASGTNASQMVALIKAALAAAPVGPVTIVVDGQTITYDRMKAIEELKFWQREAAKEAGSRPRASSIYLGGF